MRLLLVVFIFVSLGSHSLLLRADEKTDQVIKQLDLPEGGPSVYRLNYWADGATILTGAIISLGAQSLQYSLINKSCPCDANGVNFFDRSDTDNNNHTLDVAANYTVVIAGLIPVAIDYFDIGMNKAFVEDMVVYADVLMTNFALITIAKYSFQRPYPYMYQKTPNGFESEPNDYLSFYSGHTATTVSALAFASATLNLRHKDIIWPWIMTGVFAVGIATELVASAEHFKTDTIVGGMMGLAVGTVIPGLHARADHWFKKIFLMAEDGGAELVWKVSDSR